MQIVTAKTAGFCFGVNRAVDMIYKMLSEGRKVCTLGPVIHNPQVIEDLQSRGVKIISDPEEVAEGYEVVIRAHGVTKEITEKLEALGVSYTDATCPYVLKIHNIVKKHTTAENILLIGGDDTHPEVCGFRSHAKGASYVFRNADELTKLFENKGEFAEKEIIVVFQTTFSVKECKKCAEIIQKVCTNPIYFDTICTATQNRQDEAMLLSKENDAMIVIGGRFSSNTVKLKNVCEENCRTFLIERAEELNESLRILTEKAENTELSVYSDVSADNLSKALRKAEEELRRGVSSVGELESANSQLLLALNRLNLSDGKESQKGALNITAGKVIAAVLVGFAILAGQIYVHKMQKEKRRK